MGFAAARIKGYYDPWKSAIDALCTDEEQCILTNKDANYYWWMSAMFGMADSAFQNVAVAVLASYFVLVLVTKNFLVPILAVISIGSTITWVLAGIFLMGYEFEFFAAILTVMIVGMSVDYAVHLTRGPRLEPTHLQILRGSSEGLIVGPRECRRRLLQ